MKEEISKEEYKKLIDEVVLCRISLEKEFGEYVTNSIDRLITARTKLDNSTIKKEVAEKEQKQT